MCPHFLLIIIVSAILWSRNPFGNYSTHMRTMSHLVCRPPNDGLPPSTHQLRSSFVSLFFRIVIAGTEPNVLFVITIRDNNIISQHLRHFARPQQLRESQSWTRQTRSRSTSIKDKGHYVTPLELLHISYSSSNINGLKGDLCCSVVFRSRSGGFFGWCSSAEYGDSRTSLL